MVEVEMVVVVRVGEISKAVEVVNLVVDVKTVVVLAMVLMVVLMEVEEIPKAVTVGLKGSGSELVAIYGMTLVNTSGCGGSESSC